jgi:hypothetical protein
VRVVHSKLKHQMVKVYEHVPHIALCLRHIIS